MHYGEEETGKGDVSQKGGKWGKHWNTAKEHNRKEGGGAYLWQ